MATQFPVSEDVPFMGFCYCLIIFVFYSTLELCAEGACFFIIKPNTHADNSYLADPLFDGQLVCMNSMYRFCKDQY